MNNSKNKIIFFLFSSFCSLLSAPALTLKQQLNQVKKTMHKPSIIKKAIPPKKPIPKKPIIPTKKIPVVTNLNELTKAIEKFNLEQKKERESNRSLECNRYPNIQDKCPCTGISCICVQLPKLLTI